MIAAIRAHLARTSEVAELRDTVVEQAAEIIALQEIGRHLAEPAPPDWTKLRPIVEFAATGWTNDTPAEQAHADQALASWRTALASFGLNPDDERTLHAIVVGFVLACDTAHPYLHRTIPDPHVGCWAADRAVALLTNCAGIVLQFRPKETPDGG